MNYPTICALATARINSAIHIIRVSGNQAFEITNKILNKPLPKKGFCIFRRYVVDYSQIIDDVLVNCFIGPKSFTGEDTIEINCHGGVLVSDKILQLLIKHGCQLAKRGEFTKRAMLNKKMDLTQSVALNDLIHSQNKIAMAGSIKTLLGDSGREIKSIRDDIFQLIGQIEVNIDYPEYEDIEIMTTKQVQILIQSAIDKLNKILINSKRFMPLNSGLKIAIIGEPNAGKSTLLNTLTRDDKAIVSDIAGTTRDIVESFINIDGITLHLFDTAGIHDTGDVIENIGIKKTFEILNKVDIILVLQPVNSTSFTFTETYAEQLQNKKVILVHTKSDLLNQPAATGDLYISAMNNEIQPLIDEIKKHLELDDFENSDQLFLQSQLQINLLEQVLFSLNEVINRINIDPLDLLIEQCTNALSGLNKILGIDYEYDFLDELFSKFCLGK